MNEQSKLEKKHFDPHSIAPLQKYIYCIRLPPMHLAFGARRDHIVVSTLCCGRNNPDSIPGHGILLTVSITVCPRGTILVPIY